MKDSILELLLYLLEQLAEDDEDNQPDQEIVRDQLVTSGFLDSDVDRAFAWLEGLADTASMQSIQHQSSTAIRVYYPEECTYLSLECRGLLLFLEQMGILNATTREMVIDQVMALGIEEMNIQDIKWIVLIVLFNHKGEEAAFAWMQELVYDEQRGYLH